MKKRSLPILFTLLLSACRPAPVLETVEILPTPTAGPSTPPADGSAFDRSVFLPGLVPGRRDLPKTLDGATEYQVSVEIDAALTRMAGTAEVRYTNREETGLQEIYFRSFPNFFLETPLTISDLAVDGRSVEPQFDLDSTVFAVPLPAELEPGAVAELRFGFALDIPPAEQAPFSLFGYEDGILALDGFFPTVVVHAAGGWSLSDPPQWEENAHAEASFFLVTVDLPAELVVAAAGFEVGRSVSESRQTLTFAAGPARSFGLVAGADLTAASAVVGETTIRSYAAPGLEAGAADALAFAERALAAFNARLGLYPYTEFDLVATPMQASGSASPGLVVINRRYYAEGGVIREVPALNDLERTVAHELAHQWFYNLVGNDYANEVWFPEAFAQYMTALYYLDVYGPEEQALYERDWTARWSEVGSRPIPIGLSVGDYGAGEVRAIVYGRGPLFISALSDRIGEQTFDTLLATYFVEYAWELAGGESFREMAENLCACDLEDLFVEWIYSDGYTQGVESDSPGPTIVIEPGLPYETARAAVDFELLVPAFFPERFEFYGVSLSGSGEAVLNFLKNEPPMRLAILVQTVVGSQSQVTIFIDTQDLETVTVGDVEGFWVYDEAGDEGYLEWTVGGIRYRLIGITELEEALRIAESLE